MKNVIFTLAFMLIGTLAFASSADVEIVNENVSIESVLSLEEATLNTEVNCGFPLSWDTNEGSGSFYFGCDDSTTMDDIWFVIQALFF
ncbi:MAG: hypothetical protein LAT68_16405 [Cyclobacteriaceae bacterium]|nr:hypothetical protein [Cyclobacteriaceae bacterium]MCH8517885.1 hypothetical protein [Cyclobacteriaceae bacterium]